jgi:hypothetical protein
MQPLRGLHRRCTANRCAMNDGKNIIKTITVLHWAHQIHMKVRKTSLWDGDGLVGQACVAVDFAPLPGQAPAGPNGDVAGQFAPHKPG